MASSVLTTGSRKTILVVAPATLEEGYNFDVTLSNRRFTVTVPEGGVQEGDEFEIPYPYDDQDETVPCRRTSTDEASEDPAPPTGHWRNHLCSCCDVLTQATFWTAFFCAPILIAQLVTRLRLTYKGEASLDRVPRSSKTAFGDAKEEISLSFNKIVISFIAVLFIANLIPVVGLAVVLVYIFGLMVVVGSNIRRSMRLRYQIPAHLKLRGGGGALEDCLCMSVCGCCSLIQMARHTHNDKEYPGYCCTTTGLEVGAPSLV